MLTNFEELGSGPTLARQVWFANMEMAIGITRVAKANFCTQNTLRQLNIPVIIPQIQPHPPVRTNHTTTQSPLHDTHLPPATPSSHRGHNCLNRSPYLRPHTSHQLSTPSRHPTLFPIFLRGKNTTQHRTPRLYSIFYPADALQPYNKISAHLHHLHTRKKGIPLSLDLACIRN